MSSDATVFGFAGSVLRDVTLAGVTIDVVFGLDGEELERRNDLGLGPVDDRSLLEALGHLPFGWNIHVDEIDPMLRALIEGAPPGLVERTGKSLARQYRPAIRTVGVIARRRDWRQGIEVVSRFASVAPRGLIWTGCANDIDEAINRAQRLGIGLATRTSKARQPRLLAPSGSRYRRPGTSDWLFSERVFAEWLKRQIRQAS